MKRFDFGYFFLCMIFASIMGLFYGFLFFSHLLREKILGVILFFVFTFGFYVMGTKEEEKQDDTL